MKKFLIIFSIFLVLFSNMFIMPAIAEPKTIKEGFYSGSDLSLSSNTSHTVQNISSSENAYIVIFDSNQLTRELIRLSPKSEKYILPPIEAGYQIVVVGKEGVVIE